MSKVGSNKTVCGECGGLLYWDFDQEMWIHTDTGEEECRQTGRNE